MDMKTALEEMDRKVLSEIKKPEEPKEAQERLFPALYITTDLKAIVGMDETLKEYMKDLKEADSTLSQTMGKIERLRSDYTSLYGDMERQIMALTTWGDNLQGLLEKITLDLLDKMGLVQSHLQDTERTIILQTTETLHLISSLDKALAWMAKTLETREKTMRKLIRMAMIPTAILTLLMVADMVIRIIFR